MVFHVSYRNIDPTLVRILVDIQTSDYLKLFSEKRAGKKKVILGIVLFCSGASDLIVPHFRETVSPCIARQRQAFGSIGMWH